MNIEAPPQYTFCFDNLRKKLTPSGSILVSIFLPVSIMLSYVIEIREVMYIVPLILASYPIFRDGELSININKPIGRIFLVFFSLSIGIFLFNLSFLYKGFVIRGFKEIFFFLSPIFSALLIGKILEHKNEYIRKYVNIFFYFLIFAFLVTNISEGLLQFNLLEFVVSSNSTTEGTLSFVFGLFAIWYLTKKDYLRLGIAGFFLLSGSKRIAVLAFLLISVIYMLIKYFGIKIKKKKVWILISGLTCNFIFIFLIYHLSIGTFDTAIRELTGLSPNFLFMGRLTIYENIFDYIGDMPLFGYGIGYTSHLLQSGLVESHLHLLHSDVLKFVIELGLIPSIIIFGTVVFNYLKISNGVYYLIYWNILSLTDNVNIYFEAMIIMYLLLTFELMSQKELSIFLWKKRS